MSNSRVPAVYQMSCSAEAGRCIYFSSSGTIVIYTQSSTDKRCTFVKCMSPSKTEPPWACEPLPSQRSALRRGSWIWSPVSCTRNRGIFPDCHSNWSFKSARKSNSVFDVKHSCIYHKEGLSLAWKAFQSPAMPRSSKHCDRLAFQRVLCQYGLYSVRDRFE